MLCWVGVLLAHRVIPTVWHCSVITKPAVMQLPAWLAWRVRVHGLRALISLPILVREVVPHLTARFAFEKDQRELVQLPKGVLHPVNMALQPRGLVAISFGALVLIDLAGILKGRLRCRSCWVENRPDRQRVFTLGLQPQCENASGLISIKPDHTVQQAFGL